MSTPEGGLPPESVEVPLSGDDARPEATNWRRAVAIGLVAGVVLGTVLSIAIAL